MRFLLDESADYRMAAFLEGRGHEVTAIAHEHPASILDIAVLDIARREQRILITNDRDFGELIVRRGLPHAGVILFRLKTESLDTKIARLEHLLAQYAGRLTEFVVVTEERVRIRKGP